MLSRGDSRPETGGLFPIHAQAPDKSRYRTSAVLELHMADFARLSGAGHTIVTARSTAMNMALNTKSRFREPTTVEGALLERLLEANFSGRAALATLLRDFVVRTIDEHGGLELKSRVEGKASVSRRIPVEAEARDEDGVTIHLLLHVVDGRPVELEFFREDGATIKRVPPPAAFDLIVLPPMPTGGSTESNS
jgi:hypothetical protein